MNNLEINNNLRKFQFEKSLLFLEYFEDFYSRLEESKNRNSLVKSKNPDFYMLNLCVEYLGKSLFSSFYNFEKGVREEDYKKVFSKAIKSHNLIKIFLNFYDKNNQEYFSLDLLSNKIITDYDYYIKIKSLLIKIEKLLSLKYEDLKEYLIKFKEMYESEEFKKEINVELSSLGEEGDYIKEFFNLAFSWDLSSKDFKLKQRKIINLLFVFASLFTLSLLFNPLHNEFRYFEKLDKNLFETSPIYKELNYYIDYVGEVYLALKEYLHLNYEDLKNE